MYDDPGWGARSMWSRRVVEAGCYDLATMTKNHILDEIRSTAKENGGVAGQAPP